jgi:hypothetical protein
MKNHVTINNDGTADVLCNKKDGSTAKVRVDIDSLKALAVIEGYWAVSSTSDNGARPYAMTLIDGRRIYMHRLLKQFPAGLEVDHRNGLTLDNTMTNLQSATRKQNAEKMVLGDKAYPSSKTGVRGVIELPSGNFGVQIRGKWIGTFPTLEDAKAVYETMRQTINHARVGSNN